MSRRSPLLLGTTGAAVLMVAAGAVGFASRPMPTPDSLAAAEEVTSAPATVLEFGDERSVQTSLDITEPTAVVLATGGVVTGTSCDPSTALVSGTVIAHINESPVLAIHTDVPLYRDLARGNKGGDVAALQRELARLGYPTTETSTYDRQTARAVRGLKEQAGFSRSLDTLALADVVWLPGEEVTVQSCPARLGDTAASGTVIATIPGHLSAVNVSPLPSDLVDGERVLTVLGVTGPVDENGLSTNPEFLAAIDARLRATPSLLPDQAAAIASTLSLVAPLTVSKVPPAAVFGIDGVRGCIQHGDDAIPVQVVGASLGASLVTTPPGTAPSEVNLGSAITATGCT